MPRETAFGLFVCWSVNALAVARMQKTDMPGGMPYVYKTTNGASV
jgi:hypothetical protein